MQESNIEKEINYDEIKQMEEHAKGYEVAADKKDFLRNISAYEQKIILLNSKNPYEVLNYLDELDLKNSRQILNELSFDEIKQILELFTSEDKQNFYKNFSDLTLVNQFIVHDKSSSNYIKDLSFDRKVNLIDSSNKETVMASAKIYETMPKEERSIVSEVVTTANSISTLSEATDYVESNEASNETAESETNTNESNELDNSNENKLMELEEINKEILEEVKEEILEENLEENQEAKEENQEAKEENQEAKEEILEGNHQIENPNIEEYVVDEINLNSKNEIDNKDSVVNNIDDSSNIWLNKTILEDFEVAKQQAEQIEIEKIKQNITSTNKELDMQQEHVKTL